MDSRFVWYLRRIFSQIWVRVMAYAVMAVIGVLIADPLAGFLPEKVPLSVDDGDVRQLLSVLTSSMLAVSTFSLSIAVSAFSAAASNATPRAAILLQEDHTAQNVLATFLGAFVFGLVSLVAVRADFYTGNGIFALFILTVGVFVLVLVSFIQWINHLMVFGRLTDTLDRVERATLNALMSRQDAPFLGGHPFPTRLPPDCRHIAAAQTGYIQHIDVGALSAFACDRELELYIRRLPGSFVTRGEPIISVSGQSESPEGGADITDAVSIGAQRTFNDDPRFGFVVLGEIAARALSPAVNDPGTAIDVLGRLVRLFSHWSAPGEPPVTCPNVYASALALEDALEDAFRPIARDGAGNVEVQLRLQKSLAALARLSPSLFRDAVGPIATDALARAKAGLASEADYQLVHQAYAKGQDTSLD